MCKHTLKATGLGEIRGLSFQRRDMIYGYARVSSTDQNLDRQTTALSSAGVQSLITDKMSGKDLNRPGFESLKSSLKDGDTLIVVSMDRLSRSLQDLLCTVTFFGEKGVTIKFLKENIEITPGNVSPISKLLLGIMGAVAEFERNLIRERQREGIELAKKRGVYVGRKPIPKESIDAVTDLIGEGMSVIDACKKVGIGRTTYYHYSKIMSSAS